MSANYIRDRLHRVEDGSHRFASELTALRATCGHDRVAEPHLIDLARKKPSVRWPEEVLPSKSVPGLNGLSEPSNVWTCIGRAAN